jgi:hypothetical protein
LRIVKRTATYQYRDEHDLLLFERIRWQTDRPPPRHKIVTYQYSHSDEWKQGRSQGPIIKEKHPLADRYLYRLPELLKAKANGDAIWWCEGESDADALVKAGEVATAHHGGAGKVHAEQAAWFRDHSGMIILPYDLDDEDGPVGAIGAYDVRLRYRLLREVGIPRDQLSICAPVGGSKDVRAHLVAGYSVLDFDYDVDRSKIDRQAKSVRRGHFGKLGYAELTTEREIQDLLELSKEWGPQNAQA